MPGIVLDSFELIAYFEGESAAIPVRDLLEAAATRNTPLHMTEVNYAEVRYTLIRKSGLAVWRNSAETLAGLPIEFHPADRLMADAAADLKARYKISLADAFAAALAMELRAELVTGDVEFKALEKEMGIVWLSVES